MSMKRLIELGSAGIEQICDPEIVYTVVCNNYFLMPFARSEFEEVRSEMYLMGVGAYAWHDLSFLRKAYFEKG